MKKSTTTLLLLFALTVTGISVLNSCNKDKIKSLFILVENPFDFALEITGMIEGCDFFDNISCSLAPHSSELYKASYPAGSISASSPQLPYETTWVNFNETHSGYFSWTVDANEIFGQLVKIDKEDIPGTGGNNNGGNNEGNNSENGNITVYQNDPVTLATKILIIGPNGFTSEKKAITKYYEQGQVSCGQSGCANYSFPPGDYYIDAYYNRGGLELGYGPIGPFHVEAGKCIVFKMDNFY